MALTVRQRIEEVLLARHEYVSKDSTDELGMLAAKLIMEAVEGYAVDHDKPFAYFTMNFKVRTMMSDRWVDPDRTEFPEYAEGQQAHAILAAGVEALLPQRIAQTDGSWRDGAPMWTTLDKVDFEKPIAAPPGHTWRVVIDGPSFRVEHVPLERTSEAGGLS